MEMSTLIALAVVLMGLLAVAIAMWNRSQSDPDLAHELAEATQGREQDPGADAPQLDATDPDRRPYEERTYNELYDLAAERDISCRSTMNKAELIQALRKHN